MLGIDKLLADGITVEQALDLNQLTFGSLCYHKWIVFDAKRKRFVHSQDGRTLYWRMREITSYRRVNNHQFSVRVPSFGEPKPKRKGAAKSAGAKVAVLAVAV